MHRIPLDLKSHKPNYEMKIGIVEAGVLSGQFRNLERDGRNREFVLCTRLK